MSLIELSDESRRKDVTKVTPQSLLASKQNGHAITALTAYANDVSRPDSGFDVDRNSGYLLTHTEELYLPPSTKREMADRVADRFPPWRAAQRTSA
jgi:phosphopantothenoylcysteine synthetase/decarboxylase